MLLYLLSISDESEHGKITYLFNNYYEFMLNYSVKKFKSYNRPNYIFDAEDAVQTTFLKITKHIKKIDFTSDEKRIKNYIFAILKNEIVNILKDNCEVLELNEEFFNHLEYEFIDSLEIQERFDEVVFAIKNLDEKYSDTLNLVYCEEKTVKEIAKIMEISPKTVYTRLERGKVLLQKALYKGDKDGKE